MRHRGALLVALALVGGLAFAGASQSPSAAAPDLTGPEPELEALYRELLAAPPSGA